MIPIWPDGYAMMLAGFVAGALFRPWFDLAVQTGKKIWKNAKEAK